MMCHLDKKAKSPKQINPMINLFERKPFNQLQVILHMHDTETSKNTGITPATNQHKRTVIPPNQVQPKLLRLVITLPKESQLSCIAWRYIERLLLQQHQGASDEEREATRHIHYS